MVKKMTKERKREIVETYITGRGKYVVVEELMTEISRLDAELSRAREGREGATVRIKALRDLLKARDTQIVDLMEQLRHPDYPKRGK